MIIIKQDEVMTLGKGDLIQLTGTLMDGETIANDLVVSMLLSMLPKQPSKAKNTTKWISSAVGVKANDPRPVLKLLWAMGGKMYAADGHRVHRVDTDLPDGCYEPNTLKPIVNDDELKPYKFKEIFDSFDRHSAKLFLPKEMVRVIYNNSDADGGKAIGLVHEDAQFLVHERYFMQAINNNWQQTVSVSNDRRQVYGQSEYGDFIVMLCRYDLNEFAEAKDKNK